MLDNRPTHPPNYSSVCVDVMFLVDLSYQNWEKVRQIQLYIEGELRTAIELHEEWTITITGCVMPFTSHVTECYIIIYSRNQVD